MRPLLKSYVAYIPVEDGVYFEAGRDSFLFKGRALFPLVARIVSLLDGSRTVAALEGIVPEKAHGVLRLLLGELEHNHMLHMVVDALDARLPEHIEAQYSGTIGYLRDQSAHWSAVFRRWRETRIIAAGAGLSFRVMVRNLMRSGARQLTFALDHSEAPAADRAAIAASIADAKSRDADIAVDWLEEAKAVEAAESDDTRILYVNDAVPLHGDSLFRRLVGLERPDTLAGGIFRGAAVVGPQSGEGISLLATWDRVAAESTDPPYSRAARAILGSVVAFEALKSLVFDEAEPDRRDWLRRHCYHIRPDTTIAVHKLAPRFDAPTGAAAPTPLVPPDPDDGPLFDPATGCLRWDEFSGAEFPLPHRGILVQGRAASGGPISEPITQWALTPQDLDERVTARALESLAELENLAVTVAGSAASPVLADRDEAHWCKEAKANAIARHPAFLKDVLPVRIDLESVTDNDTRMLLRLVRLYTGALPHLWLLGGGGASIACVRVSGQFFRAAAAAPIKAIVEALGDSLSTLQTGRPPARQRASFLGPLEAIEPALDLPITALDVIGNSPPADFRFAENRYFPGGAASRGWIVGRVHAHI